MSATDEVTRAFLAGTLAPGEIEPMEVRETHASRVFLGRHDVYKLKKPVALGFLDYSTLRRRSRMCREEVRLNRRLAPDVYLGAEPVTREGDGSLRLNGRGRLVDYVVHMRRLADERSLASRLDCGDATPEDLARVGARIGAFHREAAPARARFGPRTFLRNARDNLRALAAPGGATFDPDVLGELDQYFREARARLRPLLEARAEAGRVRDGHGDLRAEHIYFADVITIIDCIEFSLRYRASDTALDFAFLAMDVTAIGYPDLAEPLVEAYEAAACDHIVEVLPFYCWYRAMVRAKVESILEQAAGAGEVDRHRAALAARRHIHHGLRFARGDIRPLLVAVGGLPGSGKTTVAHAIARAIGAQVASADETRKRLAGLGPGVHPAAAIDSGLYTPEMNARVYSSLFARAQEALGRGRSYVLDATFRRADDRETAVAVARGAQAAFLFVECAAPDDVVIARLKRRESVPDPWSDASVETFLAHRAESAGATGPPPANHVVVDTSLPVLRTVDGVLARLWARQ